MMLSLRNQFGFSTTSKPLAGRRTSLRGGNRRRKRRETLVTSYVRKEIPIQALSQNHIEVFSFASIYPTTNQQVGAHTSSS